MSVEFDWHGFSNENKPMITTTQHTWTLKNERSLFIRQAQFQ
ncbi:hypothetical protein [Aquicella siphonis]|nr:hypothetical protein [Aquicella siphonis]